ncbi:MAG TPA: GYF domain-containing protein [Xanthobacteraceae bacterium]|jgi:hypothetical protein
MVDGSTQYYYLDGARNQQGPVSAADIARLVRSGTIARETLMWFAGMPDWRPAGQINELASLFGPPAGAPSARPPMPPPGGGAPRGPAMAPSQNPAPSRSSRLAPSNGGALVPEFPVWGLLGRVLLVAVTSIFIIPIPWTTAALYRFLASHTSLPDGRHFTFAGLGGDIWYVFIGPPIVYIVLAVLAIFVPLLGFLNFFVFLAIAVLVPYLVIRWMCEKLGTEDGSMKITFTGSIWGLLGWNVLLGLSAITIVGWAWVLAAMKRWLCRNVSGSHKFEFTGTGLEILWRVLVYMLAASFIIPIPWVLRWLYAWLVSQVRVTESHA